MTNLSDKEILELFSGGNESQAFKLIVEKYQKRLYWHIRRLVIDHEDSNDVLQNTLLKAWKGLKDFRQESNLFTWLYRIATNESLTFINKRKTHFSSSIDDENNMLEEQLKSDIYFNGDEAQIKLQKAISSLPEKQRVVFNLKYFDEMKYEDMSQILDTSVGALKASFHHAVKKIEDFLNEN
ncbi:MAG: RNA polymerase sigma factor [Marinilabiliales bacterium]